MPRTTSLPTAAPLRTASLLAALLIVGSAVATAQDPEPGENFDAENFDGWGKAQHGLRVALSAPPQPIGGSPLLRMLDARLRNEAKSAVAIERLGRYPALRAEPDGPLPEGLAVLPTIHGIHGLAAPLGAKTEIRWHPRILRTSAKAPTSVRLRLSVAAYGARNQPVTLRSEVAEVDLSRFPAARTLTDADLAAGWTGGSVLVHRDFGGLWGITHTEIWPDGSVRVHRSAGGALDERRPPAGLHVGRLSTDDHEALAKVLRAAKPWRLTAIPKRMLIPDESTFELFVISGDAALIARVPLADAFELDGFPELRAYLDALALRISKSE